MIGVLLLLACLWLGLATFSEGGITQIDANGNRTAVLTTGGWRPLARGETNVAQTASSPKPERAAGLAAAPEIQPTTPPTPTENPPPQASPRETPASTPADIPAKAGTGETTPPPTPAPTADRPTEVADYSDGAAALAQPERGARPAKTPGEASLSQTDDPSAAEWVLEPVGADLYATQAAPISPWDLLGWLLVAMVPTGGLIFAGFYGHRYLTLTKMRVEAIQNARLFASEFGFEEIDGDGAQEFTDGETALEDDQSAAPLPPPTSRVREGGQGYSRGTRGPVVDMATYLYGQEVGPRRKRTAS